MFLQRIEQLLKENGIQKKDFLAELNLNKNSFSAWRSRGTIPSGATLQKIADYFSVTVDYLLGKEEKEDKKEKLPASNEELLEMIRQQNKTKGTAFFCGANGKVIDVPPEAESLILNLIDTLEKNKN